MRARLSASPVEEFWAIALDVRHRVVMDTMLARGSLTGVEIHPRDVFRALIKAGAAAVIFCHNHPSGDPSPSRQDIELTTRLREVGEHVRDRRFSTTSSSPPVGTSAWRSGMAVSWVLSPADLVYRPAE